MVSRAPIGGLSHVSGDVDIPLLELTIPALLKQTVGMFPDNDAAVFVDQGVRWSYAEFDHAVDQLAMGLLEQGFVKGDRIGVWSPNRFEWLLAQFATARIGAILVNVNPAYRIYELEYALNKVGCVGLITARHFKSSDYTGMLADLGSEKLPLLKKIIVMGGDIPDGMIAFDDLMVTPDVAQLDAVTATLDPNDPINIQFTSGTTGQPKGACLTHRNIVNNAHFTTLTMAFTDQDRLCIPVPFYHCFGMVMGTLGCVTKGATMVVPGEGFDPVATLQAVSQESCTALYGVSTMFVAELGVPHFEDFDLSSLRTGIMAGGPCPIVVMKDVQSRMNMTQVTIAYGMTETAPVSFQSNVNDPLEKRVTSVGRVHPHVEVRIVDDQGATVPVGAQGELLTRGYSVMQGYWEDAARTESAIDSDGWMHSGDLATIDTEGYCNITGRVKDMIVRGGENIYPREVEEFLYTHPGVSEVQVFGIPDERLGEIACAWIVPKAQVRIDPDEIIAFCKDKIAHFKVPGLVRIKDALPMTVTGKAQKFVMRAEMIKELGLSEIETA